MFLPDSVEISRVVRSIAVIILLTPVFSLSQTEHKYTVHGRVVDKAGQPIRGAQVILDTGPPVEWEDLIESFGTEADGRFSIQETTQLASYKTRYLYVTGARPKDTVTLVKAPFNRFPMLKESRFNAREITIKLNGELDVGDVPLQVNYGVVCLSVLNKAGHPRLTQAEAWRSFYLRVRTRTGSKVTAIGLSWANIENAVDLRNSRINLALPEGTWRVEVSTESLEGPWQPLGSPLVVTAGQEPLRTNLRLHR